MGLEHPDITHIRKTGYPRPIGQPKKEKYTCLDYIKEKEREQMGVKEISQKIAKLYSELEEHNVLGVNINSNGIKVHIYGLDAFLKESEGYHITAEKGDVLNRVYFESKGITYFTFLKDEDLKEVFSDE